MSLESTLKEVDESVQYHHTVDGVIYAIQLGDTLSKILQDYYDVKVGTPEYDMAMTHAMYYNPRIIHPDHIQAGDIIRLMPLPQDSATAFCAVPDDFYHTKSVVTRHRLEPMRKHRSAFLRDNVPMNSEERDIFFALARAQEHFAWLELGAVGANSFKALLGPANLALVQEVGGLYEQMKNGKITRNQYEYQRKKRLDLLSKNLRSFERLLFNGETAHQAIRINRKKGLPATIKITSNLSKLSDLSHLAKAGGVVLTGVGAAIACENIGNTEDRQEKNELFVTYVGSTLTSGAAGAALAIIFAATPLGWFGALAIGGATVLAGLAGGHGGKYLYDNEFNEYDLVKMSGVDKWCN